MLASLAPPFGWESFNSTVDSSFDWQRSLVGAEVLFEISNWDMYTMDIYIYVHIYVFLSLGCRRE